MQGICADAGVVLAYLPPYSPDFNPIEEAFSQLKAWIQKNRLLASQFETFEGFLRLGLQSLKDKAKGHFTRARMGRMVPRDDDDMEGDFDDENN